MKKVPCWEPISLVAKILKCLEIIIERYKSETADRKYVKDLKKLQTIVGNLNGTRRK